MLCELVRDVLEIQKFIAYFVCDIREFPLNETLIKQNIGEHAHADDGLGEQWIFKGGISQMRYYWDMLRHFFVSNSRHGTHSPFVYELASRIIYAVPRVRPGAVKAPLDFKPKYVPLLLDMLAYMQVRELGCLMQSDAAGALVTDLREIPVDEIIAAVRMGKVVVVHAPFRTRKSKRIWQELLKSTDVVVSINLFHFALLMRREGQRKENFVLRYPLWR